MISVLMPVRNVEAYLDAAVLSTLRAMEADDELIVVEDGSSDSTPQRLAALARSDRRIRVLTHRATAGVAASLNEALAASKADLVARMDGDDVTLPHRFARQLRLMGDADIQFASALKVDQRGRPYGMTPPLSVSAAAAGPLLTIGNHFIHPTMLARRSVLQRLCGYRDVQVEDYELWLRAAGEGYRIIAGATPVVRYRQHTGQLTRSWVLADASQDFLRAYRALLPEQLAADDAIVRELARGAISRVRETPATRNAWRQLRAHLRERARGLPAADRLHLHLRIAAADRGRGHGRRPAARPAAGG